MAKKKISTDCEIGQYLHCKQCIDERPPTISARDWSRQSVGFTPIGVQVWCNRHNCNIVHIDFQGAQHPANTSTR